MSVVKELVQAIEADPRDDAPQLVIADYLQAEGDPRGELIALERSERAGELDDPTALAHLAFLAAQYSFPHAGPQEPVLRFVPHESDDEPVFRLIHADRYFELHLHAHQPLVRVCFMSHAENADAWKDHRLDPHYPYYSIENIATMLRILSDVIHANTPFESAKFPFEGPALPQYEGSPLRCYVLPNDFRRRYSLEREDVGLAARDYHRWNRIWNRVRGMTRG